MKTIFLLTAPILLTSCSLSPCGKLQYDNPGNYETLEVGKGTKLHTFCKGSQDKTLGSTITYSVISDRKVKREARKKFNQAVKEISALSVMMPAVELGSTEDIEKFLQSRTITLTTGEILFLQDRLIETEGGRLVTRDVGMPHDGWLHLIHMKAPHKNWFRVKKHFDQVVDSISIR